jgi:hypothetical protein
LIFDLDKNLAKGGKDMKLFDLLLTPCIWVGDFCRKLREGTSLNTILEGAKLIFIVAIGVFFLLEYFSPYAQTRSRMDFPDRMRGFLSSAKPALDSNVQEILNLAGMIRLITDDQLPENKVLRYAGLIYHSSKQFGVNPLGIIAIIMAESNFKEKSVNTKTGDYGLGQVNWEYWGKDHGLTAQDLLEPSINIFLTCQVFKFFGQDFGKYHRGNGIKSNVYLVNVQSILSTLQAFAELNKENIS